MYKIFILLFLSYSAQSLLAMETVPETEASVPVKEATAADNDDLRIRLTKHANDRYFGRNIDDLVENAIAVDLACRASGDRFSNCCRYMEDYVKADCGVNSCEKVFDFELKGRTGAKVKAGSFLDLRKPKK